MALWLSHELIPDRSETVARQFNPNALQPLANLLRVLTLQWLERRHFTSCLILVVAKRDGCSLGFR
jgi:hypothetical protein